MLAMVGRRVCRGKKPHNSSQTNTRRDVSLLWEPAQRQEPAGPRSSLTTSTLRQFSGSAGRRCPRGALAGLHGGRLKTSECRATTPL